MTAEAQTPIALVGSWNGNAKPYYDPHEIVYRPFDFRNSKSGMQIRAGEYIVTFIERNVFGIYANVESAQPGSLVDLRRHPNVPYPIALLRRIREARALTSTQPLILGR